MLEKYLPALGKGCVTTTRKVLRRASFIPAGIWIVILVVLLAGARPVLNFSHRPAHLNEIAAECGYFGALWGPPMMDQGGRRVAYTQTTDNGVGIFLYDNTTGKSKLVKEYLEGPSQPPHQEILLPWSPDGASFAYLNHADKNIVIYNAETGRTEAIPCNDINSFTWPPASTWLTSDSFVYMDKHQQLHFFQKQVNGHWDDATRFIPSQVITPTTPITALSNNRIVWFQGNILWTLNVTSSNAPVKLFEPSTNPSFRIKEVSYSTEAGQFLLSCAENDGESLWRLAPDNPESLSQIKTDSSIQDGQWINGGKGYAYMKQNKKNKSLTIQTDTSVSPINLFSNGDVTAFTASADGKRLVIVGVASNEFAPSTWEYDVGSASLKCIAPPSEQPLQFVRSIAQLNEYVDLPSGRKIQFGIYLPPDFDRHQSKRYPVMFAPPYLWHYCSAFANCGVICVYVDRDSMSQDAIEKWKGDVLAVYKYMIKNPVVDTRRIFIGGACDETIGLSKFVSTNSSLWKGVILLSPNKFPDVQALASGGHAPKILISTGSGYKGPQRDQWIRQYQEDASKAGVKVVVSIYGGATHDLISKLSMRERMEAMMNFIFDD